MAKLHDINSTLVEDQGFLDLLKDLLSDSTPMVVANTVAALAEIGEVSPTGGWSLWYMYHVYIHVHVVARWQYLFLHSCIPLLSGLVS